MSELVSIIVPNYNKASFIAETLNSIISQSYVNWEVLIIDDASTDKSIEEIEKCIANDRRFKLFRNKQTKGGGSCRNIGIKEAEGKYIIFLDSDDLLSSSCLENRVSEIEQDQLLDFIVFPMGTFYKSIGDSSIKWKIPKGNHLDQFLMHRLPWAIPCPIWKKSILLKLNGFDEEYSRLQDVELHTRALLSEDINYKTSSIQKADCFYRIDENRFVTDHFTFYNNWKNGVCLYVNNMKELLLQKKFDTKVVLLRETVLNSITSLLFALKANKIDKVQFQILSNDLIDVLKKLDGNSSYLSLYIYLYNIGFYRVKGFNYFFQKMVKYV